MSVCVLEGRRAGVRFKQSNRLIVCSNRGKQFDLVFGNWGKDKLLLYPFGKMPGVEAAEVRTGKSSFLFQSRLLNGLTCIALSSSLNHISKKKKIL